MRKSNSAGNIKVFSAWISENYSMFKVALESAKHKNEFFEAMLNEIDTYAEDLNKYSNVDLKKARILEIGYGARPNKLIAMISLGYNAFGIDLDRPLLLGGAHRNI